MFNFYHQNSHVGIEKQRKDHNDKTEIYVAAETSEKTLKRKK